MDKLNWVKLTDVFGRMEADMVKSYLEANGISAQIIMDAAGQLWAPGIAPGEVWVANTNLSAARKLMDDFGDAEDIEIESE